jgi:hypothetical protein
MDLRKTRSRAALAGRSFWAACLFAGTFACASDGNVDGVDGDDDDDDSSSVTDPSATDPDASSDDGDDVEPEVSWPHLACDELVPSYCAYPFPNNVFTVEDASTITGRRVQLEPDAMPLDYYEQRPDPTPWNGADGFTPGLAGLAHFPDLGPDGIEGFPTAVTIERSLEADSPSIVLDANTGQRIPHWVELDATGMSDDTRTLIVRPAIRLGDQKRYIIALSGLRDASGAEIEATPGFAALRDGTVSVLEGIEERRGLYADIFNRLEGAGVARDSLQLAWDFTTSSRENQTSWMLHMRDEAFEIVGPDGPEYEITSVETEWEPEHIAYRVYLDMTVPLYLDQTGPGASLVFGDDGLPEPNPDMPTAKFPVELIIPHSAVASPAGLIQYGHGLLGAKEQIESGHFRQFIDDYGYVMFGVDFVGMAEDDEAYIGDVITSGEFDRFARVVDRQHQGMLNSLLAMRLLKTRFATDPMFGGMIDPDRAYYHGISQGGIFGGTYMALTTDVERGVLGVPGMPYSLLLSRSVDFDQFFSLIRSTWMDERHHVFLLALTDMLWERTEPAGYAPYVRKNMLPGTPAHDVLLNVAVGDHQVTAYGAHVMARTMDIEHVDTGIRDIFGLEKVTAPHDGSGIVEYDFGLPPDPVENLPQRECEDPHGKIRSLPEFQQQLDVFLRAGIVENYCENEVCSFPEMSGCK